MNRQILYNKRWREKNPDKVKAYKRRYYLKHREECALYSKSYNKNWREENKEKLRGYDRISKKKRFDGEIRFRLNSIIRAHIFTALKGKKAGRRWEDLVGYTLKDLMNHLEKQFDKKMSWDNYGKWHIDHIRPKSLFSIEEFKKCWALDNLQPLWAKDNLIKSDKY